jgi:hypothetical protein
MTGPPQTPNPAGGEASGAQTSDQLGRQIDGKNIQSATVVKPPPAGRVFRGQRQIGAWIKTNDGFAPWSMDSRIGVYETPGLPANAALPEKVGRLTTASRDAVPEFRTTFFIEDQSFASPAGLRARIAITRCARSTPSSTTSASRCAVGTHADILRVESRD